MDIMAGDIIMVIMDAVTMADIMDHQFPLCMVRHGMIGIHHGTIIIHIMDIIGTTTTAHIIITAIMTAHIIHIVAIMFRRTKSTETMVPVATIMLM
jgi:hypothetical protein